MPTRTTPQPGPPWPAAGCSLTETLHRAAGPARVRRQALVLTAVIAAVAGFLAVIAVRDLSARPAAASSVAPGGERLRAPSRERSGERPAPATGGGVPRRQALRHLEIGGKVTAVSATSITVAAAAIRSRRP